MTGFFNSERSIDEALATIKKRVLLELSENYPEVSFDETDFYFSMERFYRKTNISFVIVIDEWDAVFREYKEDKEGQRKYLDFLRSWTRARVMRI